MIDARVRRDGDCAIVYDAAAHREAHAHWFAPEWWSARGRAVAASAGRGAAWFVGAPGQEWVLRHFRRGGLVARVVADRYLWLGLERTRPFAEFRLTARLHDAGLPVPRPVAARAVRAGAFYTGDIITARLAATPLSQLIGNGALDAAAWRAAGTSVARLHAAGLDHADLNLHNLLLGRDGKVYVIDLDRGALRAPGPWSGANLARLRRSLDKLTAGRWSPADRAAAWSALEAGYGTT